MTVRVLSEGDAIEFEEIGRESDEAETKIRSIMRKPRVELTDQDLSLIHSLVERQAALHARRSQILDS